ncbi:hypothetical protein F4560_008443 [Saccharothrix ecbatanensis]|uniref:Uncharacterized protein n=1 Tax=Saccharothrix ecbatanensis TaxID=1105145 RepID=A0A7W9M5Z8_9PSEU|nr:hypothetical protein [Saccharothrix ecbatanensis]MBB5808675.1 hypothetical protein [Saccharothrix ecbatanensis]
MTSPERRRTPVDPSRDRLVDLVALISFVLLSATVHLVAGLEALIAVDAVAASLYALWRRGR